MGKAKDGLLYEDLTRQIIGAAMEVHNYLKPGHNEKVYENALKEELGLRKIPFETQKHIQVEFKGKIVGDLFLDMVVDDKVIVELKALDKLDSLHKAQVIGYLVVSKYKIALLINFGNVSLEWDRIMLKDEVARTN